jgi:hypothetical protein
MTRVITGTYMKTTITKNRLPYNSLRTLPPIVLLITSRRGQLTLVVSVGTCLFAKTLLSNGCEYLLIKNLSVALLRMLFRGRYSVTGLSIDLFMALQPL